MFVSYRHWLFLAIILTGSCAPVEQDHVYGTYRSNIEVGTETLEIREDGTYLHLYRLDGAVQLKNEGAWKFYRLPDGRRIEFLRYEFVPSKKFGTAARVVDWPAEVLRCGFSPCIPVRSETGYEFRKE